MRFPAIGGRGRRGRVVAEPRRRLQRPAPHDGAREGGPPGAVRGVGPSVLHRRRQGPRLVRGPHGGHAVGLPPGAGRRPRVDGRRRPVADGAGPLRLRNAGDARGLRDRRLAFRLPALVGPLRLQLHHAVRPRDRALAARLEDVRRDRDLGGRLPHAGRGRREVRPRRGRGGVRVHHADAARGGARELPLDVRRRVHVPDGCRRRRAGRVPAEERDPPLRHPGAALGLARGLRPHDVALRVHHPDGGGREVRAGGDGDQRRRDRGRPQRGPRVVPADGRRAVGAGPFRLPDHIRRRLVGGIRQEDGLLDGPRRGSSPPPPCRPRSPRT